MVASRWPYRFAFRAVAINLSISTGVKYSRVLVTEEFTMVGDMRLTAFVATIIRIPRSITGEVLVVVSSVATRLSPSFSTGRAEGPLARAGALRLRSEFPAPQHR